jgi:cytochrome c5
MRRALALGLLTFSVAAVAGCAAASDGASVAVRPTGGSSVVATIVSTRCTRCHSLDRIKAAQHDAAAWKVTIDRMRGKGVQLTDAEEQQVVDFLAGGGAAGL